MFKNFQDRLEVLEKERLEVLGEIEAKKATEKKALSLKTLEGIIDFRTFRSGWRFSKRSGWRFLERGMPQRTGKS
jgi:hypothetical protein